MFVSRMSPVLAILLTALAGAEPQAQETTERQQAQDRIAASRRAYFLGAVKTRVLVVDGERIPVEERVATIERLDLTRLRSFAVLSAGDSRGDEWIGDEEGVVGALILQVSEGAAARPESTITVRRQSVRNDTPFPVRYISDRLRRAPWVLASEDPEGDGQRAGFQDGRALWYWLDGESDTLWVRLGVYGEIDEERPAVSLSFDLDDDQDTGLPWYGANKAFTFDKMVSAGPFRREDNLFVGYNGITDTVGVRRRDWINERQGNVALVLDPAERSYIVGVALSDLGLHASRLRFIGSVGYRATWNDDLVDEGFVSISGLRDVRGPRSASSAP